MSCTFYTNNLYFFFYKNTWIMRIVLRCVEICSGSLLIYLFIYSFSNFVLNYIEIWTPELAHVLLWKKATQMTSFIAVCLDYTCRIEINILSVNSSANWAVLYLIDNDFINKNEGEPLQLPLEFIFSFKYYEMCSCSYLLSINIELFFCQNKTAQFVQTYFSIYIFKAR